MVRRKSKPPTLLEHLRNIPKDTTVDFRRSADLPRTFGKTANLSPAKLGKLARQLATAGSRKQARKLKQQIQSGF